MVKLTDVAIKVLKNRYFLDSYKDPEDLFTKVAESVCREDSAEFRKECIQSMCDLDFLPNTPTLINAGKRVGQCAACFVLPVKDSTDEIFETLKNTALIHKTGGGTGFSFSKLRPRDSVVSGSRGVSSGPVSFMKIFNTSTGEMKQGGVRRGANMGILRIDHPDIEDFITCKNEEGVLSNFNISVAITDDFMECLDKKKPFLLKWSNAGINVEKEVDPQHLWNLIIKGAHKNGEPGIVFIDEINRRNLLREIETIEATNPCGEEPLPPYGICVLGSINLSNFILSNGNTDYARLEKTIRMGVRFLDNVISINEYPLPQIKEEALKTRRIGLGIMGLADHLIKKDIRYGSPACLEYLHTLMRFFSDKARNESFQLGIDRGFPSALESAGIRRRNGTVTTIAPTGSLSLIAGCSSGCEPIFAKSYDKLCIDTSLNVKSSVLDGSKSSFITAGEVRPEEHVSVLSVLQKYIDAGISKTINAPNDITEEEVSKLFRFCRSSGCKSVSFYRDGSRVYQALTNSDVKKEVKQKGLKKRPDCLQGYTKCMKTGRGKLYVTVNTDVDENPFEVFVRIGKSGMEDLAYSEALGRLISLALRSGIPIEKVIKNLSGISGESPIWVEGHMIKSIPDAVAYVMSVICGKETAIKKPDTLALVCPDCGKEVIFEEGCVSCKECGWSKCS